MEKDTGENNTLAHMVNILFKLNRQLEKLEMLIDNRSFRGLIIFYQPWI